jgi:hypothetical protein
MMARWLIVAGLAAALCVGRPATALAQPGKDDVKKLETELDKLKAQIKDVEARLEKAKDAAKKEEAKKTGERDRGRDFRGQFERGSRGFGGFGGFGRGFGAPQFGGPRRSEAESKPSDVEKRLDRLAKEIEELRKEIKKK